MFTRSVDTFMEPCGHTDVLNVLKDYMLIVNMTVIVFYVVKDYETYKLYFT